jgi:hypothetical protein
MVFSMFYLKLHLDHEIGLQEDVDPNPWLEDNQIPHELLYALSFPDLDST